MLEDTILDIKRDGFPSIFDTRFPSTIFSIIGSIVCLIVVFKYPSSLLYAVPIYIVLRILLNPLFLRRRLGKRLPTRPDHAEQSGRLLSKGLIEEELSKFEDGNFEFILLEGKSPDIHWLQIAKEKHGYLLNLSPNLVVGELQLPTNSTVKLKDLGEIKGNRVLRLICESIDEAAEAIYTLLSGSNTFKKVYNITYE